MYLWSRKSSDSILEVVRIRIPCPGTRLGGGQRSLSDLVRNTLVDRDRPKFGFGFGYGADTGDIFSFGYGRNREARFLPTR